MICCRRPQLSTDNDGGVQLPSLRTPADGIPNLAGIQASFIGVCGGGVSDGYMLKSMGDRKPPCGTPVLNSVQFSY